LVATKIAIGKKTFDMLWRRRTETTVVNLVKGTGRLCGGVCAFHIYRCISPFSSYEITKQTLQKHMESVKV
jgi:hypothetical protein